MTKASKHGSERVTCTLCGHTTDPYLTDTLRSYVQCPQCHLVLAHPDSYLTRDAERAHYLQHENLDTDPRYRQFVSRLVRPLMNRMPPPATLLDFGAGQSSALAALFRENGYAVTIYDSFFAPHDAALQQRYDLICLSEVIEHLHHPWKELSRLWGALNPGGWLGVQTQRLIDRERFRAWHYKADPTHVAFYSAETFEFVATQLGARLELEPRDVALFAKS